MIVISSLSIWMGFVTLVEAIVPQVQDVIVWNTAGDTILNITVYHTPVTTIHHVDQIEVDVEGNITSFPVDQPSETFVTPVNLGQTTGTPSTRVRARCTIHGWSSWSEPFLIPEFTLCTMLFALILVTSLAVFLRYRKAAP